MGRERNGFGISWFSIDHHSCSLEKQAISLSVKPCTTFRSDMWLELSPALFPKKLILIICFMKQPWYTVVCSGMAGSVERGVVMNRRDGPVWLLGVGEKKGPDTSNMIYTGTGM